MTGSFFGRRREPDPALAQAQDARGKAAVALLDLDTVQREVEHQVEEFAEFFPTEGPRVTSSWAPVRDAAFTATSAYLEVDQRHQLGEHTTAEQARAAITDYDRVGRGMADMTGRIRDFATWAEPRFAQVRRQSFELRAAVADLDPALGAARQAVAEARAAGLRTVDPDAALAAAEAEATRARAGADVHGLRAAVEAARAASAHARTAAELALSLPARRDEVARRLSSTRTRHQVTTNRVGGLEGTLSELRQRYSVAASDDLAGVPGEVAHQLDLAEQALRTATTAAREDEQRWGDAETALRAARAACELAEESAQRALARLADLDAIAADPGRWVEDTRRTVRDAQRFLVDSSPTLDRAMANRLDQLSARVVRAGESVAARDPRVRADHWALLRELTEVREGTAAVVTEVRERRAG